MLDVNTTLKIATLLLPLLIGCERSVPDSDSFARIRFVDPLATASAPVSCDMFDVVFNPPLTEFVIRDQELDSLKQKISQAQEADTSDSFDARFKILLVDGLNSEKTFCAGGYFGVEHDGIVYVDTSVSHFLRTIAPEIEEYYLEQR